MMCQRTVINNQSFIDNVLIILSSYQTLQVCTTYNVNVHVYISVSLHTGSTDLHTGVLKPITISVLSF